LKDVFILPCEMQHTYTRKLKRHHYRVEHLNQGQIQKFLVEGMMGVWGQSPQRGPGAEPKAEHFCISDS